MDLNINDEIQLLYDYWYGACVRLGRTKKHDLLSRGFTPAKLFYMSEEEMKNQLQLEKAEIDALLAGRSLQMLKAEKDGMERRGLRFYSVLHPDFPQRLRQIPDPPIGIFAAGELPDPTVHTVGIVGARMCTEYGRKIAQILGEKIARSGRIVVSGMALGIDSASHAGALRGMGKTIAVLGCGADICYPRSSRGIYEQIRGGAGAVISEFPPGTDPFPANFPVRNRIISGLSDVLVVVEAREKSGSLITVDCALEQGKTVYAVPGRLDDGLSYGCNRLIAQGAGILYDLNAFLETISDGEWNVRAQPAAESPAASLQDEQLLVYSLLGYSAKNLMILQKETNITLIRLLELLDQLKQLGLIEETERDYYAKK